MKKKWEKITFQSYNIALLLLPTFIIFFSLIILVCGKLLLQQLCLPALSKHEMFIPFMFYRYMNLNCTKALRKMKRHFILCVFFPHLFMFVFLKINSHIHKHTLTFHDTSSSSISLFYSLFILIQILYVKQMHLQMQQDFSLCFVCTFAKRLYNIFMYEYAILIHSRVFRYIPSVVH